MLTLTRPLADRHDCDGAAPASPFGAARLLPRFAENLARALNPDTGLFDRQIRDAKWGSTRGTEALTSTAITLIGIDRVGADAFTTMDLSWLLSGLTHEQARAPGPAARDLSHAAMRALARRQLPSTSLFMQSGARSPMRHRLRRRLASFAEQIYPIQAAAFARLVGKGRALLVPTRPDQRISDIKRYQVNRETRPYEWGWWLYANLPVQGPNRQRRLA